MPAIAPATSDLTLGFLGEEVELSGIEPSLRDLFSVKPEDGTASPSGVARASLLNLALYSENRADLERDAALLADVTNEVACRALLINADASSDMPTARAWVQAHCQIDRNGQKTVCTEQISFLLTGRSSSLLRNIVLANLDSDLPLAFWWRGELSDIFEERLYSRIDRLLFDSESWESPRNQLLRLIECQQGTASPFVMHDFAYSRLTAVRHAVADAFDRPHIRSVIPRLSTVEIRYAEGFRMCSLYLAAWVAAKLEIGVDTNSSTPDQITCRRGSNGASGALLIRLIPLDSKRRGHIEIDFDLGESRVEISRCQTRDFMRTLIRHSKSSTEEDWRPAPQIDDVSLVAEILHRVGRNRTHLQLLPTVLQLLTL